MKIKAFVNDSILLVMQYFFYLIHHLITGLSTCSTASDSISGVTDIHSTCIAYSAEKVVEQLHFITLCEVLSNKAMGEIDGAFVAIYQSH